MLTPCTGPIKRNFTSIDIEIGLENLKGRIKNDIHHFNLFCYVEGLVGQKTSEIKKIVSKKLGIKENKINVSPKRISNGTTNDHHAARNKF